MAFTCDGIDEAWATVVSDDNPTDYILIGFADGGKSKTVLEIRESGEGGRAALHAAFAANQDQIFFGILKAAAVDVKSELVSKRVKYLIVKFIGEGVSGMAKGKAMASGRALAEMLVNGVFFNVNVSGDELETDFSTLTLGRMLIKSGGAHKPVRYEFGAGESIDVSALDSEGLN